MKQTSLDQLNGHLFEAIEMLKNNNDPKADPQETMDIEVAKVIADLGKVVVEGYKVKAQVLNLISKVNEGVVDIKELAINAGITEKV